MLVVSKHFNSLRNPRGPNHLNCFCTNWFTHFCVGSSGTGNSSGNEDSNQDANSEDAPIKSEPSEDCASAITESASSPRHNVSPTPVQVSPAQQTPQPQQHPTNGHSPSSYPSSGALSKLGGSGGDISTVSPVTHSMTSAAMQSHHYPTPSSSSHMFAPNPAQPLFWGQTMKPTDYLHQQFTIASLMGQGPYGSGTENRLPGIMSDHYKPNPSAPSNGPYDPSSYAALSSMTGGYPQSFQTNPDASAYFGYGSSGL